MKSELVKYPFIRCGLDTEGDLIFVFLNKPEESLGIHEMSDEEKISLYKAIKDMKTLGDLGLFLTNYGRLCPGNERKEFSDAMLGPDEEPTFHIFPLRELYEAGYKPAITPNTTLEELETLGFSKRLSEDELAQIRDGFRERESTLGYTLVTRAQADNFDADCVFEPEVQVYYFSTMFEHLKKIKSSVKAMLTNKSDWNVDSNSQLHDAEHYINEQIQGILSFSKKDGYCVTADNSSSLISYLLGLDIYEGRGVATCKCCGELISYRSNKEYCSVNCRNKAHRKKLQDKSEVFLMHFRDEMAADQIAKKLGLSTEYVKKILDGADSSLGRKR